MTDDENNFTTEDINMLGLGPEAEPVNTGDIVDDIYIEPETVDKILRVISNRNDLKNLIPERASDPNKTKCVHLAFRPSAKDMILLTNKLPGLELIQLPKSYRGSFSQAMCMYLDSLRIALIEGDVWGHRKDINEWANVKILKTKYDEAIGRFSN